MLDEVYSRNKFKIQDIRAKIKENKVCNFTNMPRNVIQLGISSEYELAQTHPGDISVPSILDMAQRHPEFTFWIEAPFTDSHSNSSDPCQNNRKNFKEAYVLNGDEPLGRITAVRDYLGVVGLEFFNDRITEKVMRGSSMKTTKLTKAKSILTKYFYGLTRLETMQVFATKVGYTLSSTKYDLQGKANVANTQLAKFVQNEIQKKNSTLLRFVKDMGQEELIEKHDKATKDCSILHRMNSAVEDNQGYYVMLEGDEYFTWRKNQTTPKRYKRSDMPKDMRIALGLLKISPIETFVDGAGYKLKDDQFFIRDEVQLELN